jgi:hypothetical protein
LSDPIPAARRARAAVLVVSVLAAVVVLACSPKSDTDAAPTASPVTTTDAAMPSSPLPAGDDPAGLITIPPGVPIPDNRAVPLTPVTGKPKPRSESEPEIDHSQPLLPIEGGTSKLSGTVFGPDGPLEGARVRIERWVGIDFGRLDVDTDEDGRYEADDLLGGRYKVRAWVTAASLATVTPQLVFLTAKEGEATVDVNVERHDSLLLQGALDRAVPRVGEPAAFTSLLAQEVVDDEGIVRGVGVPAAVVVARPGPGLRLDSGDGYGVTNAEGFAYFGVVCTGLEAPTVALESSGLATTVTLPQCQPVEVTTTTASTTTAVPTAATTTTRPRP